MTRGTLVALALLFCTLAAIAAGIVHVVQSDRTSLLKTFAAQELSRVDEAAQETANELDDVRDALTFAGHLLGTTPSRVDQERQLTALLAAVKQYQRIVVYDANGGVLAEATDHLADPESVSPRFEPRLREAALATLDRPSGFVLASPPVDVPGAGRLRGFSMRFPPDSLPRAIVVLADTAPFFGKLRVAASTDGSRIVVVGPDGSPCAPTDPELIVRWTSMRSPDSSELSFLVQALRTGEKKTIQFSGDAGGSFGLGSELIAAVAPVRPSGAPAWGVATLSPMDSFRQQERPLLVRLGLGLGAVALCFFGFAAYVVRESRKAIAVRERLAHADRLAHARDKNEKVLDHVPAGVMVLSETEVVTSINRFLRERMPSETVGRAFGEALEGASQEAIDRVKALLEEARRSGLASSAFGERLRLFGTDGQYTVHVVPLEPRFTDARWLVVVEDLSEVDMLTRQLLRAEKLATVGVLAAGMAHEIGTPLSVIRARAELIASRLGPANPQAEGARIITEQIARVTRTIRQLLDFSRTRIPSHQRADVSRVVGSVVDLLRFELERKKILLALDLPHGLPPIAADADQVQQVLVNVLMNACDACSSSGRISMRAASNTDRVRIEIEDDGCGIPDELRHRVFDPFFTTKKRGKGTGLGLTIAAQIVKSHRGEIDLSSRAGQGTRVVLEWPRFHANAVRHDHDESAQNTNCG